MDHSDQVNWVRLPKAVLHVWLGLARTIHMYIYIYLNIYTIYIRFLFLSSFPTIATVVPPARNPPFLFLSSFPAIASVVPPAHKPLFYFCPAFLLLLPWSHLHTNPALILNTVASSLALALGLIPHSC